MPLSAGQSHVRPDYNPSDRIFMVATLSRTSSSAADRVDLCRPTLSLTGKPFVRVYHAELGILWTVRTVQDPAPVCPMSTRGAPNVRSRSISCSRSCTRCWSGRGVRFAVFGAVTGMSTDDGRVLAVPVLACAGPVLLNSRGTQMDRHAAARRLRRLTENAVMRALRSSRASTGNRAEQRIRSVVRAEGCNRG